MVALGGMLQQQGQFDEAAKIYMHLEETFPGKGLPLLIGAQLRKGDFAAANEAADRVITENPKDAYGYLLLSAIHEFRKEWSLAETALKRGLKFDEDSLSLNMDLARIYATQGRNEDAQKVFNQILEKKPDYIAALFGKASILDAPG